MDQKRKMTFWQQIYLVEIVKGLALTISYFFKKPVTMQYPEVRWKPFPRFRGLHTLERHEDGRERCVACGLCAAVCPANCITLEAAEDENGEKYASSYKINIGRCIFCGFCEEACPAQALYLRDKYELAQNSRNLLEFDKADLLVQKKG